MKDDLYIDEGITGTSAEKRDELNRLIRDCKKGLIDRVIVKSVSRLARNTQDLLIVIRTLKDLNVSIFFEEQGIDTGKLNSEMIVTFPGMAAQQESMAISENMRWSYKKRMESGDFNTCKPPFGFDLIDGKQLVVNEREAVVVRRIFDLYLQGYGKQTIANILNEENAPKKRGFKAWYTVLIGYILTNERYAGDALLQKRYTTKILPFRQVRNNGEMPKYYVENSNPQIVSMETFEAVRDLLKQRTTGVKKRCGTHPLNGTLMCPECGQLFRRQMIREKAYWVCSGRASGATRCDTRRLSEQAVYEVFTIMVRKLKDNAQQLFGTLIKNIELALAKQEPADSAVSEIDKEIADLSARSLVIARLHTSGILPDAEFASQSLEINNKISSLRAERKHKLSDNEESKLLENLTELNGIIAECRPTNQFDEDLYAQIVDKITVVSSSELRIRLNGGLELNEYIYESRRCGEQ